MGDSPSQDSLRSEVPSQYRPLLLPALLAEDYLRRLQRADFDGFSPSLAHEHMTAASPFPLQCRLAGAWLTGRYSSGTLSGRS
jgi:hypothetical protein